MYHGIGWSSDWGGGGGGGQLLSCTFYVRIDVYTQALRFKMPPHPLFISQEPKKLVRYRDNHVVNTKGERYTVVTKKDQEGDEMKKTYVSIKPLKKYRFH